MFHHDLIDMHGDVWGCVDCDEYRIVNEDGGLVPGGVKRATIETAYGPLREVQRGVNTAQQAGDPVYLGLLDELRELHLKKAADYGDGADPLANLRQSETLGIKPWVGCMLRCNDKMQRVRSLIRNGSLANESIEDNLKDMAAYCLLALKFVKEDK